MFAMTSFAAVDTSRLMSEKSWRRVSSDCETSIFALVYSLLAAALPIGISTASPTVYE